MAREKIRGLLAQVQEAPHDYLLRARVQLQLINDIPRESQSQIYKVEEYFTNWIEGGSQDLEAAASDLDEIINS